MKKTLLFLSLFIVVALACDLSVPVAPFASPTPLPVNTLIPELAVPTQVPASATPVPATLPAEATPTLQQPSPDGMQVFYGPLSLVLPLGLASGISGSQFPRNEGPDVPMWEMTPGHTQVKLEGYLLQGKFHEPQIRVYPAQDYIQQNPGVFESIHRLDNILSDLDVPVSSDQLPAVPFFNAAQVFASNIEVVAFQNGHGIRFLTEYAQFPAPANNHDLFYEFQGLTSDGTYYIVAILPVTAPVLPETSDAGAVLPAGGVPYPDITSPNPDMQGYYAAVTTLLNNTSPQAFAPKLDQLDRLIQSLRIAP